MEVVASEPALAASMGLDDSAQDGSFTPIEQDELPPGEHKVKIELVDANYNAFPGQVVTLNFTVPEHDKMSP